MIISHKRRFIFIHTAKTAGTSIEIALSKYCGKDDIITRFRAEDEDLRQKMGHTGSQNYEIPFSRYTKLDLLQALYTRRRLRFRNHARATFIRKYVDREVWDTYFKFCFERNPWDKMVSWYYWSYREGVPDQSISDFVQSREAGRLSQWGFPLYTDCGEIVVDKVYKFEDLDEAMVDIRTRLDLQATVILPDAKHGIRKDKRSYRDVLSAQDRNKIARVFAREIAYFDYEW